MNNERTSQMDNRVLSSSRDLSMRPSCTSLSSRGSTEGNFIRGERVTGSAINSLSALYKPTFSKYPTFPSIYQTKYQHDFKYINFPVPSSFKHMPEQPKYLRFKLGESSYSNEFKPKDVQPRYKPIPFSRNRRNNPQPSIKITQNYPNQVRLIWSKLEGRHVNSKNSETLSNASRLNDLKYHRWNSR